MTTSIDILTVRRVMGRSLWREPRQHGPDGWLLISYPELPQRSIIITCANIDDVEWVHASIASRDRMPTYDEMRQLHRAVWGDDGYSYEIHPPKSQHVNIHPNTLHLWGRRDGKPVLPEFGRFGTI